MTLNIPVPPDVPIDTDSIKEEEQSASNSSSNESKPPKWSSFWSWVARISIIWVLVSFVLQEPWHIRWNWGWLHINFNATLLLDKTAFHESSLILLLFAIFAKQIITPIQKELGTILSLWKALKSSDSESSKDEES